MFAYNLEHERIGILEGVRLLGDVEARRVAFDTLPEGEVSTVFTVYSMNLDPQAEPLLYETLVVPIEGTSLMVARYRTREEAVVGHRRAVVALTEGRLDEVGDV